jgi:hypothetical protein
VNLLEDYIDTIKKNEILIDTSNEVGLEVNAEKISLPINLLSLYHSTLSPDFHSCAPGV